MTSQAETDGAVPDHRLLPVIDDREGLPFQDIQPMQAEGYPADMFVDEEDDPVTLVATGKCPQGTQPPIPCC